MSPNAGQSLKGQIALVVGGVAPGGQAIVRRLAQEGAIVILGDFSDSESIDTAEVISGQGLTVQGTGLDVTSPESVLAAYDLISQTYGLPNILCYGIGLHLEMPTCQRDPSLWQQGLLSNLGGAWLCVCEFLKRLRAAKKRHGAVIFHLSDLGGEYMDTLTQVTLAGLTAAAESIERVSIGLDVSATVVVSGPLPGSGAEKVLRQTAEHKGMEWEVFWKEWKKQFARRLSVNPDEVAEAVLQAAQGQRIGARKRVLRVAPSKSNNASRRSRR